MRNTRSLTVVACVAAGFILAACTAAPRTPNGVTFSSTPSAGTPSEVSPPPGVPRAFAFKAPKLGGGQVVGSELAGSDVAVWFWAPW